MAGEKTKKLVIYCMLAGLILSVLSSVGGYFVARFGIGAMQTFNWIITTLNAIRTIVLLAGFFVLYGRFHVKLDLYSAIALIVSLVLSIVNTGGGIVLSLIFGAVTGLFTLLLAIRARKVSMACYIILLIAYGAGILYGAVIVAMISGRLHPVGASWITMILNIIGLAGMIAGYLTVKMDLARPCYEARGNVSGNNAPAPEAEPVTEKSDTGTVRRLEAQPERSAQQVYPTNGFAVWQELITKKDATLLTQSEASLMRTAEWGRPALKDMYLNTKDETWKALAEKIARVAENFAAVCHKPYDVVVGGVTYNGWLLERFRRQDISSGGGTSVITWDYCLGQDGKLYVITHTSDGEIRVNDMIPLFPASLKNKTTNRLVAVMHGCVGALDLVPEERGERTEYRHQGNGETQVFDFPWSENMGSPVYALGDGFARRVAGLLAEGQESET